MTLEHDLDNVTVPSQLYASRCILEVLCQAPLSDPLANGSSASAAIPNQINMSTVQAKRYIWLAAESQDWQTISCSKTLSHNTCELSGWNWEDCKFADQRGTHNCNNGSGDFDVNADSDINHFNNVHGAKEFRYRSFGVRRGCSFPFG